MADIELGPETESSQGWSYEASVFADGRLHRLTVSLSFADYDLWCRGRVSPSRVVRAALNFRLGQGPAEGLADHFDCATLRRRFPQIDEQLPTMF